MTWSVPVARPPPNKLATVLRTQKEMVYGDLALWSVFAQPFGRSRRSCFAVTVAWSCCWTVVGWVSAGVGAVVGSLVAVQEAVSLVMKIRTVSPVFGVAFRAPTPTKPATPATSGSLRITSVTARCRSSKAWNDTSCAASVTPTIRPVSCCGRNPFGITTYR